MKHKRGDGFLNKQLRSLTVAALLRCLYGAIEYAPTMQLQLEAIQNIRDPVMFRTITQLCDSCNFDETANIGAKYLRLMRHVIKMELAMDREQNEKLMQYELVAIVIQKCLAKVVEKMKKDIQLTQGDKITIYELSLTFYVVIN